MSPGHPFYTRLKGPSAAEGAPRFKEIVWRVELTDSMVAHPHARLTLAIEQPRTPQQIGWSLDERPLGIQLSSLVLERGSA